MTHVLFYFDSICHYLSIPTERHIGIRERSEVTTYPRIQDFAIWFYNWGINCKHLHTYLLMPEENAFDNISSFYLPGFRAVQMWISICGFQYHRLTGSWVTIIRNTNFNRLGNTIGLLSSELQFLQNLICDLYHDRGVFKNLFIFGGWVVKNSITKMVQSK